MTGVQTCALPIYPKENSGYSTQNKYSKGSIRTNLDIDLTSTTKLMANISGTLMVVRRNPVAGYRRLDRISDRISSRGGYQEIIYRYLLRPGDGNCYHVCCFLWNCGKCGTLTESRKSPASIARSNKQWVGLTCIRRGTSPS